MSTTDLPNRPAFQNLETELGVDRAPLSRIAVVSLLIGIASSLAPLSTVLLPVSIIAMAVGAVAVWKLSGDSGVRGVWLAQLGLGLGVFSSVWAVAATSGRHAYLFAEASQHAKLFLQVLSGGDKYEALELMVPETGRQITGTNLKEYYEQQTGMTESDYKQFLNAGPTRAVMSVGKQADWQFARSLSTKVNGSLTYIALEMVNQSPPSQGLTVSVKLQRQTEGVADDGKPMAFWHVTGLEFSK